MRPQPEEKENELLISMRLSAWMFKMCDERNISPERLLEGLPFTEEWLNNRNRKVGWDFYRTFLVNIGNVFTEDEIVKISRDSFRRSELRILYIFARQVLTVRECYELGYGAVSGIVTKTFPFMRTIVRDTGEGTLRIEVTWPEKFDVPDVMYYFFHGHLEEVPKLLGHEEARVTMAKSKGKVCFEVTYPVKEGFLVPLRRSISRLLFSKKVTQELYQSLQNEYVELERALEKTRVSEESFKLLAENVRDTIWTMNLDVTFTYVSPSVLQLLGYTPEEVMSNSSSLYMQPEFEAAFVSAVQKEHALEETGTADPNRSRTIELQLLHREGALVDAEIVLTYLRDTQGKPQQILGVTRDITERKRAQLHEFELEQQLLQAQKLESLGTLAGGIAHDFNNILQAILGFAQVASEQGTENGEILQKCLKEIEKGGERGADLIEQILTFSRKEIVESKVQELQPLVSNAIKFARSSLPTTIQINSEIDPVCVPVNINATQIHQVITNLCTNAAHAMEERGGSLSVSLRPLVLESEVETLTGIIAAGDYVQLSVTDTGTGIDSDTLSHVLDPFFTTKEVGKGTGLGLAMVYGIVGRTKGGLTIESEKDEGTKVCVILPIAGDTGMHVQKNEISNRTARRGSGHVLLVDDEEPITTLASLLLESRGFTADAYNTSVEALDAVLANSNKYDVAIFDYTMPGMTGLELARSLWSSNPKMPIILATGLLDKTSIEADMPENIKIILKKPYGVESLIEAVNAVQ